jgi:hypothetical protein
MPCTSFAAKYMTPVVQTCRRRLVVHLRDGTVLLMWYKINSSLSESLVKPTCVYLTSANSTWATQRLADIWCLSTLFAIFGTKCRRRSVRVVGPLTFRNTFTKRKTRTSHWVLGSRYAKEPSVHSVAWFGMLFHYMHGSRHPRL